MRTIIKNNYNQENKFLTEMYEKECNIESDTDGFKDVKKLIKNKVDKVIKEQKKIKKVIDKKTKEVIDEQKDIKITIKKNTEDIKSEQEKIKEKIKETDKNIKNKQFTNNFKIKVPCYCITETLKSILEALKKRREKDTTNEQSNN